MKYRGLAATSSLAAQALAQAQAGSDTGSPAQEQVWAVFAFMNHGERTPELQGFRSILTPEGAQQMRRQGAAFRDRYLGVSGNSSNASPDPINLIEPWALDTAQVTAWTDESQWVSAGATAFLQAVYPPTPGAFNEDLGGEMLSRDLPNDTSVEYPLGGYQYPRLDTIGVTDSRSPA